MQGQRQTGQHGTAQSLGGQTTVLQRTDGGLGKQFIFGTTDFRRGQQAFLHTWVQRLQLGHDIQTDAIAHIAHAQVTFILGIGNALRLQQTQDIRLLHLQEGADQIALLWGDCGQALQAAATEQMQQQRFRLVGRMVRGRNSCCPHHFCHLA